MFNYAKRSAIKTVVLISTAMVTVGGPIVTGAQDSAQDNTDERIRACGSIEDTTERMDCFNAVVEGLNEGSDAPDAPQNDANAAPAAATIEPAADSAAVTPSVASPAGAAATSATAASTTTPATEADEIGPEDKKAADAGQKEKEQKAESEAASVHGTIVRSEKSGRNHFVVVLDNGQVWEETDGSRRMGLPKVGMPVKVYKGGFGGGYRMKIGNDNRIASVRRLR